MQVDEQEIDIDQWTNRDQSIMRDNIIKFAKEKLNAELKTSDIAGIHTLGKRTTDHTGACIVRFANRLAREDMMRNRKLLRNTGICLSDHLTKRNSYLFKLGRDLKQDKKIQQVWTTNCRIFAKLENNTVKQMEMSELVDKSTRGQVNAWTKESTRRQHFGQLVDK